MSRVSRPRRLARSASPALVLAFALGLLSSFADVPVSINYVGHLDGVGSSGESTALAEKSMLMVFRLYDVPGTGKSAEKATALWGRQASVSLSDGDFDVDLADNFGSVVANAKYVSLADALGCAATNATSDLYLGLTPADDNNAEIFPRQKLTAVPKAVLAQYVTSVPDDFTVTGGVFSADAIEVTGSAQLDAGATYPTVTMSEKTSLAFNGGICVDTKLRAGRTDATVVKAAAVETGLLKTDSDALVTVTGRLEAVGTPVWDGALQTESATLAAREIAGAVSAHTVSADTLKVETIDLAETKYLDEANKTWRIVKEIEEQTVREQSEIQNTPFVMWNAKDQKKVENISAMFSSYWIAPYDCIAYFQTYVKNTASAGGCACVQFYLVDHLEGNDFTTLQPVGYASADQNGLTVETVVPILVRKGEIVKWLAYNNNHDGSVGVKEINDTKVTAVRCQPFNW